MPEDVPFTIDESNSAHLDVANYIYKSFSYVFHAPNFQAFIYWPHSFFIRGLRVAHELLKVKADSNERSRSLNGSCSSK